MATDKYTVSLSGSFDYKAVLSGIEEIKKKASSIHIGDEIAKELQKSLNKLDIKLPKINNILSKDELNERDLEKAKKIIEDISTEYEKLLGIISGSNFTQAFSKIDLDKLKELDKQLNTIQSTISKVRDSLIKEFNKEVFTSDNPIVQQAITDLFNVDPGDVKNKFKEIENNIKSEITQIEDRIREYTGSINTKTSGISILRFLYGEDTQTSIASGKLDEFKNKFKEIINEIQQVTPGSKEAKKALKELTDLLSNEEIVKNPYKEKLFNLPDQEDLKDLTELKGHLGDIINMLKEKKQFFSEKDIESTEALAEKSKILTDHTEDLKKAQEEVSPVIKENIERFDNLNEEVNENAEKAKTNRITNEALANTFGSLARRIENTVSALTVFYKSIQIVRKAINSVKELDAAFTQIAIVSGQTNEQAWAMFDSFNQLAKQYSITTKDLTEGAKLFYQQGLNAADTMKMVEASTVSAALGEVTMAEAANTLTAAIQGYNESAAVAMDYTDKIAMVGAVSAADFNELSTAMEKTASSAYTAGIDFDHLLGYLGKMIEVTREAPANLGTAMKTIIARFEDMKKDPMAILEDGVSANKVEAALATIGIALRDSEGEFRALQDVMDELGIKWNSLTRNQQAYIATVAAGSRQQSRFLALMNNYDRTLDLIAESQNSMGAAAEQYAIYQDSAAAATARLTAAWEEFYNKIVNSEQIIWVINALEKLVETMSKIGPVATAIGTTVGALGLNLLGKAFIPKITEELAAVASTGQVASLSIGAMVKGGGALLLTFGKVVAVMAVVGVAIYGVVKAGELIYNQFHKDEIAARDLANSIKDLDKEIGDLGKKTDSLESLLNKYDELNNKIYLTEEEQKELNSTIEQISNISNTAITWIDEMGNAHIRNKEAIKQELEMERERQKFLAQEQMNNLSNLGNIQDVENLRTAGFNNTASFLDNYNTQTNRIKQIQNTESIQRLKEYNADLGDLDSLEYLPSELIRIITQKLSEKYDNLNLSKVRSKEDLENVFIDLDEDITPYLNDIGFIVEEYYNNIISFSKDLDNFDEQFNKYFNQELTSKIYGNLQNMGGNEAILGKALQEAGITFSLETLDQLNNLLSGLGKEKLSDIEHLLQPYEKGELSTEELLQRLKGTIDSLDTVIENHLKDVEDKANKEFISNRNKRIQFLGDNLDFFDFVSDDQKSNFVNNEFVTDSDMKLLGDLGRMNFISDKSKLSLWDFLINDNKDELNKKLSEYTIALEKGMDQEAQLLHDYLINILKQIGFTDNEINSFIDDQIPKFREYLEKSIDEDFDNFAITQKGINDLTSLKSKERTSFFANNANADKYIDINDDGEEYLNVLGKIILLEQKRIELTSKLNNEIDINITKIGQNLIQINNNKEELEKIEKIYGNKIPDDLKEEKVRLESNTNELLEQNNALNEANEIYQKRLNYINKASTVQQYESMALQSNVNKAEEIANNIKTIAEAWAEYQLNTEDSDLAAISSLNQLDARYQSLFMTVSSTGQEVLNLNQDIVDKMIKMEEDKYQAWRQEQIEELEGEKTTLQYKIDALELWLQSIKEGTEESAAKKVEEAQKAAQGEVQADKDGFIQGEQNANKFYNALNKMAKEYFDNVTSWAQSVYTNITNPDQIDLKELTAIELPPLDIKGEIDFSDFNPRDFSEVNQQIAKDLIDKYRQQIDLLTAAQAKLGDLSPDFQKTYKKAMADAAKGGKEADKSAKNLAKTIENMTKALENLDKLIKEVNYDLNAIKLDYNPFTDLFEAWEKEWDYYYNIKRLIQDLGQQGQYIDNIISADFTSADQKVAGYHAKIGNLIAQMAANDTYITSLRTGMSQTAIELMEQYGEYYKIDPNSGQIFQTDKNLDEINTTINAAKEELYNLSKVQNARQNDLNLENSKLEALEQEKSAYESILSEVESQIDSYKNLDDVIVDTSELEENRSTIKAKIEISNESIEAQKEKIRNMEEEIQDLEIEITLKDNIESDLEEYVEKMEEKVQEYEEYWETLNSTIAEQQDILNQLNEVYDYYVDTAISTQQDLYNAIVENYQNEIDQKKEQYDYLKQLDKDYLDSVKNSISQERQAREEVNKQKSYQQSLQRLQLLQQDTSGAYRNEISQLGKEVENQRQELYDDLVDKQVEALEKEIDKRHELYDKEVAALEERLAYMQENAILLWEMVNTIMSEGFESMISQLESTTEYINTNELNRQKQRKQWEQNTKITYDGVVNNQINNINAMVEKGRDYIDSLKEIKTSIEANIETYKGSTNILIEKNASFQTAMDSFMTEWNRITNSFTGYYDSWEQTVSALKTGLENNLQALIDMNNEGGSIKELDTKLRKSAEKMYNDFIDERQKYKNELDKIIKQIQDEISAAIKSAANAITSAANSAKINPSGSSNPSSSSGSGGSGGSGNTGVSGSGTSGSVKYKGYTISWQPSPTATVQTYSAIKGKDLTYEQVYNAFLADIEEMRKRAPQATFWGFKPFITGGLANFTGPAWLDGSPSKPERILSPHQTKLFESMVNSLEKSTNSNINSSLGTSYNIGDIVTNIQVDRLDNETDINKLVKQVEDKIIKAVRNRVMVSL